MKTGALYKSEPEGSQISAIMYYSLSEKIWFIMINPILNLMRMKVITWDFFNTIKACSIVTATRRDTKPPMKN